MTLGTSECGEDGGGRRPLGGEGVYDVVIVGGALSGASTAILLLREEPKLRVLIVERSVEFSRRVGEATVEISTYFLRRCLGLSEHLSREHLVKNGLRFWFSNERAETVAECAEVGGKYLSRVPAYLVDRATLDEEVLRRAEAMGAELWRPAAVTEIELVTGGLQRVRGKRGGGDWKVEARWVVDASGVAAMLARRNGWLQPNLAHPTTAVWARWRGVKDFDSLEMQSKYPEWAAASYGIRGTATNHLVGLGWWAWWIPLKAGEVSIGVVFDERWMGELPEGGGIAERLKTFLMRHPVARELMADATPVEGDVHWRRQLPYSSRAIAGDGFALVGDAAGFLDPFYSPGMDWLSFTAWTASRLVLEQRRGTLSPARIERVNRDFAQSYERWFEAIYRNKYAYLGEFDLLGTAFLMDVGLYYLGVAAQPFRRGESALGEPYFSTPPSVPFYYFIRTYHRRMVAMAENRRRRGVLGRFNDRRRMLVKGFSFGVGGVMPVVRGMARWFRLELTEGWRSWGRRNFAMAGAGVEREGGVGAQPVKDGEALGRERAPVVASGR